MKTEPLPRAVIFDLDGVVVDTAHLHFMAWQRLAQRIGIPIDAAFNEQLKGVSRQESLLKILAAGGKSGTFTQAECDAMAAEKNADYVGLLAGLTTADILPGISELLHTLREEGVLTGLASVSQNAPQVLRALGLAQAFDYVADTRRITHSKPHPEIFLNVCEALNIAPQHAAGIEDAQAGIDALRAGGIFSIGIGATLEGANHRLDSTEGLSWAVIRQQWLRHQADI
ncbi:beta-phosphoglucomutase [Rahnella aquatilis CIP 78.65 = ATCC 33071]|uniref:Beta-phosphoglucomutase n=1 Tax=Rahnella aquatilis (strain ATCC 33071 / DSM 4594 / JCM 1683 / NBRC 105701 / NCIMB 13365 / CIP 78.65) TaxID=745277 RepID=H2ITF5_RAHAC|nr:beta-phosphoglucomutase [Rahnella aquatilis]AEX53795.1 beta-phosphoglucomutase [Rahnella aquatilis CIP 78.65 = ATCC 33071]KFD02599.1 beta-phosphoglucomutase [Rahnella aquatilis CIP 78.65 = ATCC 33071]